MKSTKYFISYLTAGDILVYLEYGGFFMSVFSQMLGCPITPVGFSFSNFDCLSQSGISNKSIDFVGFGNVLCFFD